jgi:hypothetical protein
MDDDLDQMSHEELLVAAREMRAAIRAHRDSSGQELCWHHPDLWDLLPEPTPPAVEVPEWPQFMRGCVAYRTSLDAQAPGAPRVTREFDERADQ